MRQPFAARKVDANHGAIRDALRGIGVGVVDTSATGYGFADLTCFWRGSTVLVEVKDGTKPPSERRLTPDQIVLHKMALDHGVKIPVVESVAEALALFGAQ